MAKYVIKKETKGDHVFWWAYKVIFWFFHRLVLGSVSSHSTKECERKLREYLNGEEEIVNAVKEIVKELEI